MKNRKGMILFSFIIICIPLFIGLALWNQLPDPMPTHWNAAGEVDGYSSKAFGVLFMPAFLIVMQIFILSVCMLDPKGKKQMETNKAVFLLVVMIIPMIALLVSLLTYGTVFRWDLNVSCIVQVFLGILYLAIGMIMPRLQQNYTVGVKLPWTLDSKTNWEKTGRLAGYLFIGFGILFLINAFANVMNLLVLVLGSSLILIVGLSWYSAREYQKEQKNKQNEANADPAKQQDNTNNDTQ